MYRILWTEAVPEAILRPMREQLPPGWHLEALAIPTLAEALRRAPEADFLMVSGLIPVSVELLTAATRVRFIQKWGSGMDQVDMAAVRRRGVPIARTLGSNAVAVAEHTILLILAALRLLPEIEQSVRAGIWPKWNFRLRSHELAGRRVALLGVGEIGSRVAARLRAFDVALTYHKRTRLSREAEAALGAQWRPTLDHLLRDADILTLMLPLSPDSRGLIGRRELALMPPGSLLVNTARGAIVDSDALASAINSGHLAGAALDVFPIEPVPPDHPLLQLERVIVTGHCGGATYENLMRTWSICLANFRKVAAGETLAPADLVE